MCCPSVLSGCFFPVRAHRRRMRARPSGRPPQKWMSPVRRGPGPRAGRIPYLYSAVRPTERASRSTAPRRARRRRPGVGTGLGRGRTGRGAGRPALPPAIVAPPAFPPPVKVDTTYSPPAAKRTPPPSSAMARRRLRSGAYGDDGLIGGVGNGGQKAVPGAPTDPQNFIGGRGISFSTCRRGVSETPIRRGHIPWQGFCIGTRRLVRPGLPGRSLLHQTRMLSEASAGKTGSRKVPVPAAKCLYSGRESF